jgi:transcriptional regulator with XRE-family HTH domain
LGAPHPNINHSLSSATDWKNQIWVCKEVGSLFEMLPWFDPVGAKKSLRKSLIVYLEQVADGNVLALAKHIRCSHRNLQSWLDGAHIPQLDSLLRISRFLDVPTSSLFSPSGPTPTNIVAANQSFAVLGKRDVFQYRHSCKIRQALLEALNDAVPLSLSDVARRLGYTGIDRLYASDRKLCNKIVDRYRKSDRGQWWSKPGATRICEAVRIKEILEQSLKSSQTISVFKIAASLGYANSGFIRRKFPDLCTAISQRIAEANQARFERMHQVLENSLQEDPAPTLTDLSHRLGYSAPTVLRVHEPALCSQIAARYPADHTKRRAAIERRAAAMLEETPVPSVRDVCKRLGITVRFMDVYFPATRSLIAQQHRRALSIERESPAA